MNNQATVIDIETEEDIFVLPYLHVKNSKGVKYFDVARIATELGAEASRFITEHSRVLIVGYDGPNLSRDDHSYWQDFLTKWLAMGCSVEYLLLGAKEMPDSLFALQMAAVRVMSKGRKGSLVAHQVDPKKAQDREAVHFCERWRTFHFAVFENPRQLWIEGCHRPGYIEAEDCLYFSPEAAEKLAMLDLLKKQFERFVKNYCKSTNVFEEIKKADMASTAKEFAVTAMV